MADEPESEALIALLTGCAEGSLKLRKEIYGSARGLMVTSSSGPVREMCLRLMVAVVGSQRATVVGELSSLLRREPTISMRNASLTLLRGCFDDAYRTYTKDTDFSMADDDDADDSSPAISSSLSTALINASDAIRASAGDDTSPKIRRAALIHTVAISINMENDPSSGIKFAASRCFDTASVRTWAPAFCTHSLLRPGTCNRLPVCLHLMHVNVSM